MLREGRLRKGMDRRVAEYTSSLEEDRRIFRQVVKINIAHTIMLHRKGIISREDASKVLSPLLELLETPPSRLKLAPELEDIHMVVEDYVTRKAGRVGGKIHIAKSRNDQVAAALRLQAIEELTAVEMELLALARALAARARETAEVVVPGYTHLQVGEPTTFGHYLLAYAQAFLRDCRRIAGACERLDSSPMGACSLAGTSFGVDRKMVAGLLGFSRVDANTMDAVSSRDTLLEAMAALSIAMVNISRLSEDMIIWSSLEFGFVDLPEEFCSTSSIMPQKKNPVAFETARAKAGEVIGLLSGALSMVKALPQSYNLDLQELTPLLWRSSDETRQAAEMVRMIVSGLRVNPERMMRSVEAGFATAVDLANWLVRSHGLDFRQAHAVAGRVVYNAIRDGKGLKDIGPDDVAAAAAEVMGRRVEIPAWTLREILDPLKAVSSRKVEGGPSPAEIRRQVKMVEREISGLLNENRRRAKRISLAEKKLLRIARGICG